MRLNPKQIAEYTGGQFIVNSIDPAGLMTGITWDSRDVQPGWLYVALVGQRVDGHDFVGDALAAGAAGALVMQSIDAKTRLFAEEMGACIIEVPNTESAIVDLARAWRPHLRGHILGLTGSTGKTTTKNLVRDVAAAGKSVVATYANQNNELGVPKTLLTADPETEVVVVEMGMRGLGQIAELCEYVRPTWGLVTNVGECHIELLGSKENIVRAKAELFEALPAGTGTAFINGADDNAPFMEDLAKLDDHFVRKVYFDSRPADDLSDQNLRVWAEDVSLDGEGCPHFTLCAKGFNAVHPADEPAGAFTPSLFDEERVSCRLSLRGVHNVSNACAAAAVGRALGIDLATIARALESSVPESGRQEVLHSRGGYTVVNDAYNANPDSMRASLSTFCALQVPGRRVAVLGDMGELGSYAQACHEGIGVFAANLPLDRLICVGELAQLIAEGAKHGGMDEERISCAGSVADVLEDLEATLERGDAVLVKASHFMGLNRVVEGLIN